MGKSWSSVVQEDKSVALSGDAKYVLGTGAQAIEASPASVVVAGSPDTTLGDIVFNQFPEAVERTVGNLVGMVDKVTNQSTAAQLATTQALATKLQQTEAGPASILPETAKWFALAGLGLGLAWIVLRRKSR